MKKIKLEVYLLEGCDKCKKLKSTLDLLKIEMQFLAKTIQTCVII